MQEDAPLSCPNVSKRAPDHLIVMRVPCVRLLRRATRRRLMVHPIELGDGMLALQSRNPASPTRRKADNH